jgi:lipopolysaccharide transport system permease protein
MVGVVDGFRWALLGTNEPPGLAALVSFGAVSVLLFTGLLYFRRTERTFADTL